MENKAQSPHSFKDFLPAFLVLILAGGVGLALVTTLLLPTLGPRWLFFFCLVLVAAGLSLPATYFFDLRFPSTPPAEKSVIIRQAMWVGIFVALISWLQMGRVLTLPLAVILGAAFVLIEVLLRLWERSRWKPQLPTS
ncbi:MAG: hypothetical protein WA110_01300 [Anaerolineaceae bacterium]